MNVATEFLLKGWVDFDEFYCVFEWFSEWFRLTILDPVGQTWKVAQTGILRFTMEIVVYKWLLLVI